MFGHGHNGALHAEGLHNNYLDAEERSSDECEEQSSED
jgi:hypothetical protein